VSAYASLPEEPGLLEKPGPLWALPYPVVRAMNRIKSKAISSVRRTPGAPGGKMLLESAMIVSDGCPAWGRAFVIVRCARRPDRCRL